jgi:Asp-tRNA(Asn)/Glu-tRNA(Gln) amidotransferase A subunit family amidase
MLASLAEAVRVGKVSPRELVEEALRRIDAANGDLNAVVRVREEALAEADTLSDERRGPLAGLPLLVKDLTDVEGLPTTYGTLLYGDAAPAVADATFIARLRAAGAIVVGKTNTPSFGWNAFTDNKLFGASRNPWNLERSPGGSSGGSAAALAAGLAPLATSTDGGGSVRIPASMSGLVGYKPTQGLIGRDYAPRWMTFSTSGATGASVADVMLEMSVLEGPTPTDINALAPGSVALEPVRPARVLACATWRAGVDPAVAAAFDATVHAIDADLGVPVTRVDSPFPNGDIPAHWFTISSAELSQSLRPFEPRWDELDAGLADILRHGIGIDIANYVASQRVRYEAAATFEALLAPDAVMVVPTCNVTSWPPAGPIPQQVDDVHDPAIALNTVELNFTGHPGVTVPIGTSPEGVPIGMQIVAPRFADRLALGLAAALETARPWPQAAPGYEAFPMP